MTWLQQRLDELGFTHADLVDALEIWGIIRTRATISGWARGTSAVTLLFNPEEARILAKVLQWTVWDLLCAAGYTLNSDDKDVPPELWGVIQRYRELSAREKQIALETMRFGIRLMTDLSEDDIPSVDNIVQDD